VSELLYLAAAAPKPPKLGIFVTADNTVFALIWAIVQGILVYVLIQRARAGQKIPEIRKITGMEAFDEAVGRATEMGKPVHITNYGEALGDYDTFAYWSFLAHVAKLCASYDTRIIVTDSSYLVNAVNMDIVRQAYLEVGRPDAFNPDDVRYISGTQFAWTMGVAGIIAREQVASQFLVGYFYAEALILAEVGNLVGAIQVAATSNTAQLPFFIVACDYTLIGEEFYAGAAYLSKEPVITGSVVSQDIMRLVLYALVVVGTIMQTVAPKANFIKTLVTF